MSFCFENSQYKFFWQQFGCDSRKNAIPLMISFDCCASNCFCSVPLFVLPFGLPGPRFSPLPFFVSIELSSKVLVCVLLRFVAGCIGLRFPGVERTVPPMVSCGAGCTVLICGLIWAVFGGTLLSDFFRLRSEITK